jgi:hypothetical protein
MKLGGNSTASSSVLKLLRIIHKIGENRIIAITHAKIPTLTLLRLAAFAIGGDSIHWVNQILGKSNQESEEIDRILSNVPPGSEGLFYLHYLSGERLNGTYHSRAQFFGLSLIHTREFIYRAVAESLAMAGERNLQKLQQAGAELKELIVSGGGAMVQCLELEKKLMEQHNLRYCRVCPAPGIKFSQVLPGLATLGASVLEEFIRKSEPTTIAIGTGRTIRACVRELKSQDMPHTG